MEPPAEIIALNLAAGEYSEDPAALVAPYTMSGGTLSSQEIEDVPSNFRTFTALTQLIPGITPNPAASTVEGGQGRPRGLHHRRPRCHTLGRQHRPARRGTGP